jgi:hypothetical protein
MPNNDESFGGVQDTEKKKAFIRKAITAFQAKLENADIKVTPAEYIRLLELLHEIDGDEPREIRVTWVDQIETESSTEK